MTVLVIKEKAPQESLWFLHQNEVSNYSTGSTLFFINNPNEVFFNSMLGEGFCRNIVDQFSTQHNLSNKQYIKFYNLISEQYNALSEYFVDISLSEIKSSTSEVVSFLLALVPDAFSVELTGDASIFYTFKKDGFSFYIQHFFEIEDDGFNATLIKFKGEKKLDSTNGNISELLASIESHFFNNHSFKFLNLTFLDELSY